MENQKGAVFIPVLILIAVIGALATGYVTINKTGGHVHPQALKNGQAPVVNQ